MIFACCKQGVFPMTMLEDKYNHLRQIYDTNNALVNKEDLDNIQKALSQSQYYDSDMPRIMFMGQFKSGKSSLINAIFGKTIAATDIFEMTAWLARYYPSTNEFADMVTKNNDHRYMDFQTFLNMCNKRAFKPDELKDIDHIDIGVQTSTKCAIIDTPGFGSQTEANEEKMKEGLKDADYIIYVISSETLGSHKEAALASYLQESNIPMTFVVSKADTIYDKNDRQDIAEWISDNYRIDEKDIVFSSSKTGEGIDTLKKIINNISINNKSVREQANTAYQKIIEDQYCIVASETKKKLGKMIELYDDSLADINTKRINVAKALPTTLISYVRNHYMAEKRSGFIAAVEAAKSQDELHRIVQNTFDDKTANDQFCNDLNNYFIRKIKEYWGMNSDEDRVDLRMLNDGTGKIKTQDYSTDKINKEESIGLGALFNDRSFLESSKSIAATAGVMSILMAISPAVTIASALSGIGVPIAILGIAASAWGRINKSKHTVSVYDGKAIFDNCVDTVIKNHFSKAFEKNIAEQNSIIAQRMLENCETVLLSNVPKATYMTLLNTLTKQLNERIIINKTAHNTTQQSQNKTDSKQIIEVPFTAFDNNQKTVMADGKASETILNSESIRDRFISFFDQAEKYIILFSSWIKCSAVNDELINKIQYALDRGVNIYIMYGIAKKQSEEESHEDIIEKLSSMKSDKKHTRVYLYWVGNDHRKIVVIDNKFVTTGSFNILSFNPYAKYDYNEDEARGEDMTIHYDQKTIVAITDLYKKNLIKKASADINRINYSCLISLYQHFQDNSIMDILVKAISAKDTNQWKYITQGIINNNLYKAKCTEVLLKYIKQTNNATMFTDFINKCRVNNSIVVDSIFGDNAKPDSLPSILEDDRIVMPPMSGANYIPANSDATAKMLFETIYCHNFEDNNGCHFITKESLMRHTIAKAKEDLEIVKRANDDVLEALEAFTYYMTRIHFVLSLEKNQYNLQPTNNGDLRYLLDFVYGLNLTCSLSRNEIALNMYTLMPNDAMNMNVFKYFKSAARYENRNTSQYESELVKCYITLRAMYWHMLHCIACAYINNVKVTDMQKRAKVYEELWGMIKELYCNN